MNAKMLGWTRQGGEPFSSIPILPGSFFQGCLHLEDHLGFLECLLTP